MDAAPIFLIGFMATGKSTVGPLLAERLGRRFVDLDARIEAACHKSIPTLFREEGEAAFRRHEAEALARVAEEDGMVIGCGGGTPCFHDNLARMQAVGVVVALLASLDDVLARAGDASTRPLLAGGRAQAERLYAERQSVYRSAGIGIETGQRTPVQVADEAARRVALHSGVGRVQLGARGYPIHLAPLARVADLAHELLSRGRVAVVTDENVAAAGHACAVADALGPRASIAVMPAGESAKTLATVERIASDCVAAGLDRGGAILAVGGGVVGDLAGFTAAMLFRGVAVAQIPTTLLAMVDSAIGGKTGVDLPAGKNLVGAFWQPRFVLADTTTLQTLPPRECTAAYGEIVKYGLLGDAPLFALVEESGASTDPTELVRRCALAKARIVASDEEERSGARAVLNLGHTVGHAIELASGFQLLHGEAVALGLIAATRISERLGIASVGLAARTAAVLRRAGLGTELEPWLRPDVLAHVGVDKKRQAGRVRFIAVEDVGRTQAVDLTPAEISALLEVPGGTP